MPEGLLANVEGPPQLQRIVWADFFLVHMKQLRRAITTNCFLDTDARSLYYQLGRGKVLCTRCLPHVCASRLDHALYS